MWGGDFGVLASNGAKLRADLTNQAILPLSALGFAFFVCTACAGWHFNNAIDAAFCFGFVGINSAENSPLAHSCALFAALNSFWTWAAAGQAMAH